MKLTKSTEQRSRVKARAAVSRIPLGLLLHLSARFPVTHLGKVEKYLKNNYENLCK